MSTDPKEELLEALFDLAHDLGKYLRLPLAWLPAEATEAEVRVALERALLRTREGAAGVVSARALWDRFREETGGGAEGLDSFPALAAAVAQALSWEDRLAGPIDRAAALHDLSAVGDAIRTAIEELSHET